MPREKELFRDNLQRLDEHFPQRELLSIRDVAGYCQCDVRTAKKRYKIESRYIEKVKLASLMS